MRIFIYLYILKLIAHTESVTHPKAVNVQLETVLEFNDKDKDADVNFIGNIQKILKKVKTALSPESGRKSLINNYNNHVKHIQFTDFILAAIDILLSYDDDDLENAFSILDDEIRKYHYKGCKFYELVEDENIRKLVAINLENLKKKKARELRKKLYKVVNIIGNAKLVSSHKIFLNYINSLYRQESSKTFMNILQNLENYSYKSKRSNMNLIEITRYGIRSVLFDHFSKLHSNVRKDIKKNIENTWSHSKKSKQEQTNEYDENDFAKEDKKQISSSNELNRDIKINNHNDMDTTITAEKKKHALLGHTTKKKKTYLNQHPVKNAIVQINQEYTTKELKFEPLSKGLSANKTNEMKDDFLIPIPMENAERKPGSFERKERKVKNKRNKQNKLRNKVENTKIVEDDVQVKNKRNKPNKMRNKVENTKIVEDDVQVKNKRNKPNKMRNKVENTKIVEDDVQVKNKRNKPNKMRNKVENTNIVEDDIQLKNKRYKNKHKKLKANVAKTESVEDTVVVKEETRHSLRSESSMTRPKTGLQEEIFMNFDKLDEKRESDTDIETKAPPRKHENTIKRKIFKKPTMKLNLHSLSDEGMSIEYGNHRRTITSDKESEIEKEKDNERHKASAEIIRKHFINRIHNLEKQMEEIVRKIDEPPTNTDVQDIEKETTEKKAEFSTKSSNKDNFNVTIKTNKTKGTTQSFHIIIGPEYVTYKNNISNKIPSTEVITNSLNITDKWETYLSDNHNTILSKTATYLTDFDYSEAGIMKELNINFTLPEEKPKTNDIHIAEKPKKSDGDIIKGKETGLQRIDVPIDMDNEIVPNKKVSESEMHTSKGLTL